MNGKVSSLELIEEKSFKGKMLIKLTISRQTAYKREAEQLAIKRSVPKDFYSARERELYSEFSLQKQMDTREYFFFNF